ncbi:MAG: XylR N-terminal domain-containing protein [Elusimicrobia bacterium]|nr:XylR N-terminal domain-containing protein [Elusimicrobiota bacterium]
MRVIQKALDKTLKFLPRKGRIELGGARAILINASAMGLLRKALVDTVGLEHCRRLFSQQGFACGMEEAISVNERLRFSSKREWLLAGAVIHGRIGHVLAEPMGLKLNLEKGTFLAKARWKDSYEAEQHLEFLGKSDRPTCWSLTGYASGWATAVLGEKALALETRCRGQGHSFCAIEIRTLRDWGKRGERAADGLDELTRMRREVERRELSLYQAFKRSNDVMFYCDRNGLIQDINEAFTRHYGYTPEEVVGKKPSVLRSRHSTDELYQRMWEAILDPKRGYWRGEIINQAKDGREVPLVLTITAVRNPKGEIIGYISNAMDMSEQFALRARVAQSETLASIGEMAAVIAHEIRNPLGSIVMAAKQIASAELAAEDLEMVRRVLQSESQRLNETLNNFLAYARPREVKLARSDLNALVRDIADMIRSNTELRDQVQVRTVLSGQLKPFPMDPDQIRQVLWNIVLNGIQAMGGQGLLGLETGRDSGFAYLKVKDTGPGIPTSVLPKLFKPFFTTKQQGTGLGLAIADRIVKAHGGRIQVKSEEGQGTSFSVYLPWNEA